MYVGFVAKGKKIQAANCDAFVVAGPHRNSFFFPTFFSSPNGDPSLGTGTQAEKRV
jgi:hypothetical protein